MYAPGYVEPVPPMVSTFTAGWSAYSVALASSALASGTFESANRGVWYPIWVPVTCVARRMFWSNGASVSGNTEAGIYLDAGYQPGAKLITTGSVAQSGGNTVQFADITDTVLVPGRYWLYISASTTGADYLRVATGSASFDELLRMQQASIGPGSAPATATPVESTFNNIYMFGFATTASP